MFRLDRHMSWVCKLTNIDVILFFTKIQASSHCQNICKLFHPHTDVVLYYTTAESRAPLSLLPLTIASLNSFHFWQALCVKQPTVCSRVNCKGLGLGLHLQVLSSLSNKLLECPEDSISWKASLPQELKLCTLKAFENLQGSWRSNSFSDTRRVSSL